MKFKYEQILQDQDYYPTKFYRPKMFISVYKNLENLVISHVLDYTVSHRLLSSRLNT